MQRTLRLRVPALTSPPCLFYVPLGAALFSPGSAATPCQFFPIHQRSHSPTIAATPDERHTIPPRPLAGLRLLCSPGNIEFGGETVDGVRPGVCSSQGTQLIAVFHSSHIDFSCLPEETVGKENQYKNWKQKKNLMVKLFFSVVAAQPVLRELVGRHLMLFDV